MCLDFVEFTEKLTIMVNTGFDSSRGLDDLARADHGRTALEGVGLAAHRGGIGAAHVGKADRGILGEGDDDLAQRSRGHSAQQTVKNGGVDGSIGISRMGRREDFGGRIGRERGAQRFERQRLGEDAIVAVEGEGRGGGHGEQRRARGGVAKMRGEFGAGQAGHAKVREDAVGGLAVIGEEVESFAAAGGLQDGPSVRFQENGGDGKADGIVVDGEDTAHREWTAWTRGPSDCTRRVKGSVCLR